MIASFVFAIGFSILLFKVSPALLTNWINPGRTWVFLILEGSIRVALLVAYLVLIGLFSELRRVFQYHAAEHKAINAYEAGAALEPEEVQRHSLIHVRCGTAFLLWVMVIAILVFSVLGRPPLMWLIASRIVALPLIAGLAYEVIRLAAKYERFRLVRAILAPGLWLQRLTTREPTLDQVAVSIAALKRVLAAEKKSQSDLGPRVEVMA
jgi:uncharacterized protein YqhQ